MSEGGACTLALDEYLELTPEARLEHAQGESAVVGEDIAPNGSPLQEPLTLEADLERKKP